MKILVVDDDEVTRLLIQEILAKQGFDVVLASKAEEAWAHFQQEPERFPLVLSDIRMCEMDGMKLLDQIQKSGAHSVVILMTAFGSVDTAVEAIQKGAFDYISKPFQLDEFVLVVQKAAKHWESLRQTWSGQTQKNKKIPQAKSQNLIGQSPQIVEIYKTLARASLSQSSVLIVGESGSGKELVARSIHEHSARAQRPFTAVNCGALTESLLESELFGHMRGAFTGALAHKKGLLSETNGGTLFLDEVGDMSLALQVKLLRVLQQGEYKPVGSEETRHVDIRIIAATHRDLEDMVKKGSFREDLYYRLKVITIQLPALRERKQDLPELVSAFVERYAQQASKVISHVSPEAMEQLMQYSWPGNIRELEHAIEHAVAMTRTMVLDVEDFPRQMMVGAVRQKPNDKNLRLEQIEKDHILKVLKEADFNKSKASELLGIDRATLYRKVQRYGIELPYGAD